MNFETVGVVGAGAMGTEIALVFALSGHQVNLVDVNSEVLEKAHQRIDKVLTKGVTRGFYSQDAADEARQRIRRSVGLTELSTCEVVIEAVFEDLKVKTSVLRELDGICPKSTVFATNTSTIPISTLAASMPSERSARFIGTHFFSPASRMRLVEVIPAFRTSEETVAVVLDWLAKVGKAPIRVKDVAGFAVNRIFHVFLIEAVRLVEEGVATPEDIDTACKLGLGHPMGPFELMDATTSSLCLQAQEIMYEAYGERFRPRPLLKQRVQAGLTGGLNRPGWRR